MPDVQTSSEYDELQLAIRMAQKCNCSSCQDFIKRQEEKIFGQKEKLISRSEKFYLSLSESQRQIFMSMNGSKLRLGDIEYFSGEKFQNLSNTEYIKEFKEFARLNDFQLKIMPPDMRIR